MIGNKILDILHRIISPILYILDVKSILHGNVRKCYPEKEGGAAIVFRV